VRGRNLLSLFALMTRKPSSSDDDADIKYTKAWYDAKIAKYTAQLEKAKTQAPYTVKGIEETLADLRHQRRYASIKIPPSQITRPLPSGGPSGRGMGQGGRGAGGGGSISRGK